MGTLLARAFHAAGADVAVLSRQPASAPWRVIQWDARSGGSWTRELEGADAVINLAGRNVNCRYTRANRDAIMRSRVDSARVVGQAIAACATTADRAASNEHRDDLFASVRRRRTMK